MEAAIDPFPVTITGPSGKPYLMHGPETRDHQANHWKHGRFYEALMLEWLYDERDRYDLSRCLDLGASLGNHTVFMAGELGADVVAIEPFTPHIVQQNLTVNNLKADVRRRAIGHGAFRVEPGPQGNIGMTRLVKSDSPHTEFCIQGVSVKSECEWATFCKVDIEGMALPFIIEHAPHLTGTLIAIECEDPEAIDRLLPNHGRIAEVFNATPTYIYLPINGI